MPPPPTLSLSNFLNPAASSSRKRSHAEITRSQSRSATPDLPSSKRRRLSPTPLHLSHSSLSTRSPTPSHPVVRSERHGYDYRAPVMSTRINTSPVPSLSDVLIDLTADSDGASTSSGTPPRGPSRRARQQSADQRNPRAPPFVRGPQHETHEVIDLSDYDASDFDGQDVEVDSDTDSDESDDTASDVVVLAERRATPRPDPPQHHPTPPANLERGAFGYLPGIIRRSTQFMFDNVHNAYNEVFLDRLDGIRNRANGGRQDAEPIPENDAAGNFVINLDYRQPAFALGGLDIFDRSSETPQVVQEPYKGPPAAKEGFTRTFAEEDVILCPMCGDELALGEGDIKQQVWVVKGCGHVYCGECATNRFKTKAPKKDNKEKKLASTRSIPFQVCNVDGCNVKVNTKTAMFPIYL